MKKFVLKLDINDDRDKRKALKTISALSGIDELHMDMKGKKLMVIGTVDPVSAVSKLRKYWPTDIISVGPAKEPEKKEEPKKEEPKKEEPKKEEPKKEEGAKTEEPKKEEPKKEEEPKKDEPKKEEEKKAEPAPPPPVVGAVWQYRPYHPPPNSYGPYYPPQNTYRPYYPPPPNTTPIFSHSMDENPNACIIC